jgi:hypothetical protein
VFDKGLSPSERRDKIIRTQLCESFANATELFAQTGHDTGPGELFVRLGFYGRTRDAIKVALERLGSVAGPELALELMVLASLHANFLGTSVTRERRQRVLGLVGIPLGKIVEHAAEEIFVNAFSMSASFRLLTTGVYFKQVGLDMPVTRALDFDFLAAIERSADLRRHLQALARIATA